MKIHTMEQRSPEWFAVRANKMTASNAQAIGNNGKGLDTYIVDMMAESISSAEKESYTNDHIERGRELEEQALSMYELENGVEVQRVGFVEHDEFSGCSPDGLVNEDGGIEVKCHADKKHFRLILNGEKEIDSGYLWQVQMCLLVTGRAWWDFVAYSPNFEKSLLVFRIYPDPVKQEALKAGIEAGTGKIKAILSQLSINNK